MLDKRIIEQVLSEQYQELSSQGKMEFCSRYEEELVDLDSNMAQVVIGVRRSGKSVLCYNVLKKHEIFLVFEVITLFIFFLSILNVKTIKREL